MPLNVVDLVLLVDLIAPRRTQAPRPLLQASHPTMRETASPRRHLKPWSSACLLIRATRHPPRRLPPFPRRLCLRRRARPRSSAAPPPPPPQRRRPVSRRARGSQAWMTSVSEWQRRVTRALPSLSHRGTSPLRRRDRFGTELTQMQARATG